MPIVFPWYVPRLEQSYASYKAYKDLITHISPCWFTMDANGEIATAPDPHRDDIMQGGQPVVPLIANKGFSEAAAAAILADGAYEANAERIVQLVIDNGYAGINLDFEGPFGVDRDRYTRFVQAIAKPLQEAHKLVTVDVVAQTKAPTADTGSWAEPFDYQALGTIADYVMVMGYDYGYASGPPQPVSPAWWLADVIAYTTTQISASKVVMGLPMYGRHWTIGANGRSPGRGIPAQQAETFVSTQNVGWQWDERAQVPYAIVNDTEGEHHVHMDNAHSLAIKIKMVQEAGLAGLAFWCLGEDAPEMWEPVSRYLGH